MIHRVRSRFHLGTSTMKTRDCGATFIEYALVLAFFGFVAVGLALEMVPKSEDFVTNETIGLLNAYPAGFLTGPEASAN